MCLTAERSLSEVYEVRAPIEHSSFILDEIGHINYSPFQFSGELLTMAKYFRAQVISYDDLCEDG